MNGRPVKLMAALNLDRREHLAVVGAGGKTSLLLALAEKLGDKKVVISTTTRIDGNEAPRSGKPVVFCQEPGWKNRLRAALARDTRVVLVQEALASGKMKGISPSMADELFLDQGIDYLLLEADGAAGRPLKAPAVNEPVIPGSVTRVVALIGLEAVDQIFCQKNVFRETEFQAVTGLKPGQRLVPEKLFSLFVDPQGLFKGAPPSAVRIAFLNKLDLLTDQRRAFILAELIVDPKTGPLDRVIIGSIKDDEYDVVR